MGHTMAIALYRIQDGLIVGLMTYRIALLGLIPGIARPRLTLYVFEISFNIIVNLLLQTTKVSASSAYILKKKKIWCHLAISGNTAYDRQKMGENYF